MFSTSPETTLVFDHKLAADRTDPAWLDLTPRLGELAVPVQVIQGADDPIFPPPTGLLTAEAVPHATLLTVEGMGHMLEPAFFAPLTKALSAHIAQAARAT
jgi:10-carbomethoxy-13-deoxycarminomycin esterase